MYNNTFLIFMFKEVLILFLIFVKSYAVLYFCLETAYNDVNILKKENKEEVENIHSHNEIINFTVY